MDANAQTTLNDRFLANLDYLVVTLIHFDFDQVSFTRPDFPTLYAVRSRRPTRYFSYVVRSSPSRPHPAREGNRRTGIIALKVKVAHSRLPSVGFRNWSRFLAVSLWVTRIINPTVGCHYFPPGLQLPPQPLRGLLPMLLLGEQRHNGCEQFA